MNRWGAGWFFYLSAFRYQNQKNDRNCEGRRYEQGSVGNVEIELNWLKKKVNNTFVEADWLNILVDKGANNVTSFKLTKYNFTAAYLDTSALLSFFEGDENLNNSHGGKRMYPATSWRANSLSRARKGYDFDAYQWPWIKTDIWEDRFSSKLLLLSSRSGTVGQLFFHAVSRIQ